MRIGATAGTMRVAVQMSCSLACMLGGGWAHHLNATAVCHEGPLHEHQCCDGPPGRPSCSKDEFEHCATSTEVASAALHTHAASHHPNHKRWPHRLFACQRRRGIQIELQRDL